MRKVEVTSYNPTWTKSYQSEAKRIQTIFSPILVNIYHIGSTSIPGLSAKPVIDILVEVSSLEKVDDFNQDMEKLDYEARGENGIPKRRYFQKGGDNRTHHVHIFEKGNTEIERHVTFRDYLRNHPQEADQYGALKEELAEKFPYDIEKYILGKDSLVKELDEKAKQWRQNR
ncbi:GrpB family protein [Cytobacillus suaedae]|nr:GrpB family protein [Cytobacillus suaedae]